MIFEPQAADRKVRVFSLSQSFLEQFKNRQPKWGFGGLGYFTYKRCVTVDTPVLCDDLVWRPAGSLDKGQGIIGFDEDPVRVHHYDYRYIRLGTVMHNSIEEAEVMGIRLEDGTVLYAMPDHPWLVKYAVGNRVYWRETKDLQATKKGGDVYLMRPFGPVWDVDKTYEGGFLSAAYDGEGSLDRLNGVTFTQKDNVFLARVENYLTAKGVPYKKSLKKGKTGHMFVLRTHGLRHLLPLLGSLQPPRLLMKFKEGVAKNLAGTMLRCAPEDWVKVVSIFPAGVRHIAVLSTDIKTHFTGGFASHNTYARELPDGTTEEWWQTCQRVVEGCFNIQKIHCRQMGLPWKEDKAQGSAQDMFQRMWDFKFTPPGRGLWVMGTDLVYDRGSAALQNCAFVSTDLIGEDFAAPFCFLMDMSMLGVGVGGDTRGAGRVRIITPRLTEDPYVVADSREGWVDLLRTVLNSFVGKNAFPTVIDYSKVRGRGTPIKTFGGIASGPKPLHMLIEGVTRLLLPKGIMVKWDVDWRDDQGRIKLARATFSGSGDPFRISSTQIVDVFNYVGKCVVAGGVRRTAEIMFGEPDDTAFLTLKQDQEALLDRRWASNNSIFARVGMDYSAVVESAAINGEPGIMWLDNSRAFGRMADPPDYKDRKIMGTNPCVTGDTITMTSEGPRRGDQLVGQPFKAYLGVGKVSLNIDSTPEGFFVTGQKPVYLLQTKEGHSLKLTLDHPMHVALRVTRDGVECADIPAGELQPGALLVLNNTREIDGWSGQGTYNEGWLLGSMLGDGHLHKGDGGYAVLQFWGPSRKVLLDSALSKIKSLGGPEHYHDQRTGSEIEERDCCVVKSKKVWELAAEFGITPDKESTSDALLLASSEFQRGFLCGLFDADGSVQGSQEKGVSVRLSSSTKQHLIFAQRMLLGLGINSTIYWNRREAGERLLPDGHGGVALYPTKDQHELVISKDNLLRFQEVVGFCDPDKSEALVGLLGHYRRTLNRERFLATFESLTYLGVETVYDCTIPQNHHFSANGFVTHNCGEQPLESFELCVSGDTPIHMLDGVASIKSMVGVPVKVWNGDSWSEVVPRVTGHNRELFRVFLSDGSYLDCTANHGWHVLPKGKRVFRRVETAELTPGSQVVPFEISAPIKGVFNPVAFETGLFVGDGFINRTQDYAYPMVTVCGEKSRLRDLDVQGAWWKPKIIEGYTDPVNRLSLHGLIPIEEAEALNDKSRGLTPAVFSMDRVSILEFVAGWIESDGSVTNAGTPAEGYRVYGSEPKIRDLQVLLRRAGINHATIRLFEDAGAETNFGVRNYALWYCQIPSFESGEIPTRIKRARNIGTRWAKNNAHPEGACIDRARKQKVVRVERLPGLHTTYCFDEPENHMAVFGNSLTYQCNLVETYPAHHDTYEDFERTLKMAYLYAKTVTLVPTHDPRANAVMTRNRRIGCSMSGITQAMKKLGRREFLNWCDKGYAYLGVMDQIYSDWLGVPLSIKKTSVKPSGTVSLLCGATPGIHYPHSEYYIRWVRVANTSPLVQACVNAGYEVHPDPYADDTSVVGFPVHEENFSKGKDHVTVWEQFVNAVDMQNHWADNQVSVTITFRPNEKGDLKTCLETFETSLKGLSMLPAGDEEGHGYKFPPYQAIDRDQYEAMMSRISPLNFSASTHDSASEDRFCSNDSCMVRLPDTQK